MERLTNEADFLLCCVYKAYLEQRRQDVFRQNAVRFGPPESLQETIVPGWPVEDIEDVMRELNRKSMTVCRWGDNTFSWGMITTDGIIYMEDRFGRKMDKLLERISALKELLSF